MKKILLVDDDLDMLETVQAILVKEDYKIQIILEWEMVYREVREFKPDVIFLDAYLDGVDGRIICRNLKNDQETKHIPVVVYSAHAMADNAVTKYGADAFIPKPFFIDQLLKVVNRWTQNDTE